MLGSILITLALVAGLLSVVMYLFTYKGVSNTLNIARISYHVMAILTIVAATIFMHAILTHQYQYKYVYDYSGSGLALGLTMSTFYAGQEGSFFLWTLMTVIVGVILQQYSAKRGDLEPRVMAIFGFAASFLLMMISPMLKNPFAYIWSDPTFVAAANINPAYLNAPFLRDFFMSDGNSGQNFVNLNAELYALLQKSGIAINDLVIQGKGLNPLLQNFWMQIHPPMLFVGFAMSTVPFAFAIAALMKNEYRDWLKHAFPWVLAGAMILGLSIMLGGYWAYGVLGWGGYWGWDPVENSSLVPWLIGVASIHTFLVQKKSLSKNSTGHGEFAKTNLILSIMTYVLVLYSTFLTRSGILGDASVHSFTDPGYTVYLFLVIFILSFTFLGIGMLAYRWKTLDVPQADPYKSLLNRELALFTGSVALLASAVIILVGTSAPIFKQSVEIKFYNQMNLPIAIIIGLLNGLSLLMKWKSTEPGELLKKSVFSVGLAAALTVIMAILSGVHNFMLLVMAFSAAFSLFTNAEIAYKIIKGRKLMLGAYISHIGIAVFLLGVVGSAGYSENHQLELPLNEPKESLGYTLTFKGYTPFENGQKFHFNIEVSKDGSKGVVKPVMFVSQYNNSIMKEPDVLSELTKDLYISPLGFDDGTSQQGSSSHVSLGKGETAEFSGAKITFDSFNFPKDAMNNMMNGGDFQIGAKLKVEFEGKSVEVEPLLKAVSGQREFVPAKIEQANLSLQMESMDATGKVNLLVSKLDGAAASVQTAVPKQILTIEASVKPLISLVWTGVLLMVFGFIISTIRRTQESQAV